MSVINVLYRFLVMNQPCISIDFTTALHLLEQPLAVVNSMKQEDFSFVRYLCSHGNNNDSIYVSSEISSFYHAKCSDPNDDVSYRARVVM